MEHLSPEEAARDERLDDRVARAVRRLHREAAEAGAAPGDVLVFLPGAAEIRWAREALSAWAAGAGVDLLPLHGDLPPEEQDRAVRPGPRPKVILSTNVAESSVTIEGVTAVVDSGLARIASHSPWSGLPTLEVKKVSRASAAQRAGRAGRTGAGPGAPALHPPRPRQPGRSSTCRRCSARTWRSWSSRWPGSGSAPRPAARRGRASWSCSSRRRRRRWRPRDGLLRRLGALDGGGALTPLGRRMLAFPAHPRLARLVVEAAARGAAAERGAAGRAARRARPARPAAGWRAGPCPPPAAPTCWSWPTSSRRRRGPASTPTGSGAWASRPGRRRRWSGRGGSWPGWPAGSRGAAGPSPRAGSEEAEQPLLLATLAAYPDRVARRRAPGSDEVVLAGGGSARLDPASVVREAPLLVALDAAEPARRPPASRRARRARGGEVRVRLASAVTQEMLLDLFPGALRYEEAVSWNAQAERVEATERLLYEDLMLEESRAARPDPAQVSARLAEEALARGARAFAPEGALDQLAARLAFAAVHAPEAGLAPPAEADLAGALRQAAEGRRSFAELREADLPGLLLGRLEPRARAALERLAPERLTLPGGRGVRVHYEPGRPPWVESRLQDFFGMAQGPAVAGGRVALVLHLLAPNGRAQQVTTDLAGFWDRHYPASGESSGAATRVTPGRRTRARRRPPHPAAADPALPTRAHRLEARPGPAVRVPGQLEHGPVRLESPARTRWRSGWSASGPERPAAASGDVAWAWGAC